MCYDVSTKLIVVNYFKSTDVPLTYNKLREIRSEIIKSINGCSNVDISLSSVLAVVEQYSTIFKWNDDSVVVKNKSSVMANRLFNESYIEERNLSIKMGHIS